MKKILLWPIERILRFLYGYDFFISYAHADGSEYSEHLRDSLEAEPYKFSVHLDTRDFSIGEDLSFLTRTRVSGSRMLVVVARKHALTSSKWVRDEVEIFVKRGRSPSIIDVANAVAAEPVVAKRLSEWIAHNPNNLRLADPEPEGSGRCAPREVIDRIAGSFDGVRTRVLRERIIALSLFILFGISTVAVWQAYEAFHAEKQARSRAFAAAAYSYSDRDPTLAMRLAQRATEFDALSGTGQRAILRAYNSGSWFYDQRIDGATGGDLSRNGSFLGYIVDDVAHIQNLTTGSEVSMPALGASLRLASNGNVMTWSGFEEDTTVSIRKLSGALVAHHKLGRSVTAMDCGKDIVAIPAFMSDTGGYDDSAPKVVLHLIDIASGNLITRSLPNSVGSLSLHGACALGGNAAVFVQTIPFALAIIASDIFLNIDGVNTSEHHPAHASISPDGQRAAVYLTGAIQGQADGILAIELGEKDAVATEVLTSRASPSRDSGGRIMFLDNQRILVASTDGWLEIVDLKTMTRLPMTDRHRAVDALAIAPESGKFVVARRSGVATVYSREGEPIASLMGHTASDALNPTFRRLKFDEHGLRLITTSRDGIRSWRPRQNALTVLRHPNEDWFDVPANPFVQLLSVGPLAKPCGGTRDGYGIDDAGVASQCFAFAGQEDKLPTQFLKPDISHLQAISHSEQHLTVWLGRKFARFFVLDPGWALTDALTTEEMWMPDEKELESYIR